MDDQSQRRTHWAASALSLAFAIGSGAVDATPAPNTWHEVAALPMTWIQDLSFVSARVGFAAGGDGQVLRTTDGGVTWTPVIGLDYPYYWYGVHAVTPNDIVAAGFIALNVDSTTTPAALIRWSHDGGDTWTDDLVLSDNASVQPNRVHFWNSQVGFVATNSGPDLFRTTSGGFALTDWSPQAIDETWFGAQFSALPNGRVRISGYRFCESPDFAATWSCQPSIDTVFDGATFFLNDDTHGWVGGGGGIGVPEGDPPKYEGWVHRTTDGGATWSERTLDVTWPVRAILFVNKSDGWAMGGIAPGFGNDSGGAYISHDGGVTWSMEADLEVPFQACATADYHLFCAGTDSSATSHVFERDFDHVGVNGFE